jgi:hypothetical protein
MYSIAATMVHCHWVLAIADLGGPKPEREDPRQRAVDGEPRRLSEGLADNTLAEGAAPAPRYP